MNWTLDALEMSRTDMPIQNAPLNFRVVVPNASSISYARTPGTGHNTTKTVPINL
jgi:hypothetical protein